MFHECFEVVEGHGEELMQLWRGEDTRVKAVLTQEMYVTRTAHVFAEGDRFEVTSSVVGGASVDVVDTVCPFGYRTDEGEIDRVRSKDVFVTSESVHEFQIPLFSFGVVRDFAVCIGCVKGLAESSAVAADVIAFALFGCSAFFNPEESVVLIRYGSVSVPK